MKRLIWMLAMSVSWMSACGGGSGEDYTDTPSCATMIGWATSQGCGWDGATAEDMLVVCLETTNLAFMLGGGCPRLRAEWMWCIMEISNPRDCETCNDELGRFNGCLAGWNS